MISKNANFIRVTGSDLQVRFLYYLLKIRKHNISHIKMPNFSDHKKFVEKNPYKYWYIIELNEKFLGSFYIKSDNSIGLNLVDYSISLIKETLEFIRNNFTPERETPSIVPPYFYLNTSSTSFLKLGRLCFLCPSLHYSSCFQTMNRLL